MQPARSRPESYQIKIRRSHCGGLWPYASEVWKDGEQIAHTIAMTEGGAERYAKRWVRRHAKHTDKPGPGETIRKFTYVP